MTLRLQGSSPGNWIFRLFLFSVCRRQYHSISQNRYGPADYYQCLTNNTLLPRRTLKGFTIHETKNGNSRCIYHLILQYGLLWVFDTHRVIPFRFLPISPMEPGKTGGMPSKRYGHLSPRTLDRCAPDPKNPTILPRFFPGNERRPCKQDSWLLSLGFFAYAVWSCGQRCRNPGGRNGRFSRGGISDFF